MNRAWSRYSDLVARYVWPQWPRATLLLVLVLGGVGLQLSVPLLLRAFVDGAMAGRSFEALTGTALWFVLVALGSQGVAVAAAYVGEDVGWNATNAIRCDLLQHCLQLDLRFHNARTPGELIERIDGDVSALASFFSAFVVRVLASLVLLVGTLAVLFSIDWRAGTAMTPFALAALVALYRVRDLAAPHWRAERQASASLFSFVEEQLGATEDIRSCDATAYVLRQLHERLQELLRQGRRASILNGTILSAGFGVFALGDALALGIGAALFYVGAISLGTVYAFFTYAESVLRYPLLQVVGEVQNLQRVSAAVARIAELYELSSVIEDGSGVSLPDGPLPVALENLSFSYDEPATHGQASPHHVLHNISFRLAPGERLGLLGRTGSGKTTLARLLLRLYDPSAGRVMIGDTDLTTLHQSEIRQRVGLVTQDIQLFGASVRDNLTLFDHTVPDERLVEVLHELGLADWYTRLPDGLDTELAPGGDALSAGEAQLLAFARVFVRDPGLAILDEASSRLDSATERRIEEAIERLMLNRTVIVIAHRLATVQHLDTIMILADGRVAEHGPRAALERDRTSRYARLRDGNADDADLDR